MGALFYAQNRYFIQKAGFNIVLLLIQVFKNLSALQINSFKSFKRELIMNITVMI